MPIKLGASNPQLGALRDLRDPRGRREQGLFAFEGALLLEEARRSAFPRTALYATPAAWEANRALLEREATEGTPAYIVADRAFARISDLETPPGILATAPMRLVPLAGVLAEPGPVVLLAGIADPGNAGTLVRSADAFGVSNVIFGRGGVDPYHPKVVRSAMGSLFRSRIALAAPEDLAAAARDAGRPVVAADTGGEPLGSAIVPENAIIAIGNERHGVRSWLTVIDRTVSIPQPGAAESLNAGVAGSIVLYELTRQRDVTSLDMSSLGGPQRR